MIFKNSLITGFIIIIFVANGFSQDAYEKFYFSMDSLSNSNAVDEAIGLLTINANELKLDTLKSEYVRNLMCFGYAYFVKKQFPTSRDYYMRSIDIELKVAGESFNVASSYLALGHVNSQIKGHAIEGFEAALKAKEIFVKLGAYNKAAQCYASLSNYFSFDIDLNPPIFFSKMAYRAIKKETDYELYDLALIERSTAIAYITVNTDSALRYYRKGYETLLKSGGGHENYLMALCAGGVSESALEKNNLKEAEKYITISCDLFRETVGEESYQMGSMYTLRGDLYDKLGEYDSALVYANKALAIYRKFHDVINWDATCYILMSDIEENRKNYNKAIEYAYQALYADAILTEVPEDSTVLLPSSTEFYSSVQHRKNVLAIAKLHHKAYIADNQSIDLQKSYEAFVNYVDFILVGYYKNALTVEGIDNEFSTYINDGLDFILEISEELFKQTGDTKYLYQTYNYLSMLKAGLFNNQNNMARYNDPEILQMLNKENQIAHKLEKLNFKVKYNDLIEDSLNLVLNEMESAYVESFRIKTKIKEFEDNNDQNIKPFNFNIESFLSTLDSSAVMVDYYYNDSSLFVFTVEKNKINLTKVSLDNDFLTLIRKCTRQIKTTTLEDSEEIKQLSDLLIVPISKYVENKNKITIIPFRDLTAFPFDVLNYERAFLTNKFAVSKHFSSVIALQKTKAKMSYPFDILSYSPDFSGKEILGQQTRDLLFADSLFRTTSVLNIDQNKIASLPFAKKEVETISTMFAKKSMISEVVEDNEATKEHFKENASKARIIHVASHAFGSSTEPQLSGIFFASKSPKTYNGYMFLSELFGVTLNADLVVLSACQSGKGAVHEYGGSISLPSSFIYAGVPNVIASLWKVHDEKTKDLMVAFYKHLLEDKVSYAEALRLAKLDCIERGFLPIDWAGFVLIGN